MSAATRVGGTLVLLMLAGGAMSLFGNPPDRAPIPREEKTKAAITTQPPSKRHVVIRFDHRFAANDMVVDWSFGKESHNTTIDKIVSGFEVDDTVDIGTVVWGTAHPLDSKYNPPESMRVQIYFDNRPQCPDHFFGNAVLVKCQKTVA